MKFILGKKIQMSQVFKEDGQVVPVTIVVAGPCVITQVKEKNSSGYNAAQMGFIEVQERKVKKPQRGHLKDLPLLKELHEFVDESGELKRGDKITVANFEVGEKVGVTGVSKGKGFQGVVRRHGFAGGPATHGHKDNLRMPGAIGAGGVQRVFKGLRMAGHMGSDQVTVKNLEIIETDSQNNILKIKGALPGARNSLLIIKAPGKMTPLLEVKKEETPAEIKESGNK